MSVFRSTARLDSKGRLLLPRKLRHSLSLNTGDTVFLQYESKSGTIRLAKASNPFDILAEEAEREYEAGKTVNIRTYAKKHGIKLDEQ